MRAGYHITHVDGTRVRTWEEYTELARPRDAFRVTVEVRRETVERREARRAAQGIDGINAPPQRSASALAWYWQEEPSGRRGFGGRSRGPGRWRRFDDQSQEELDECFDADPDGQIELETPLGMQLVDFSQMLAIDVSSGVSSSI